MKKRILLIIFLHLGIFFSYGQVSLSGYLLDSKSKEAVIGATVSVPQAKVQSFTNEFGYFQLRLPKGQQQVFIQAYGFQSLVDTLTLNSDSLIMFWVSPYEKSLDSIMIEAKRVGLQPFTGSLSLSSEDMQKIPMLLGEADVLKAFQMLPGVQGGAEGTSGLNVRGGTPDQNLILLDGVPVYNASHAFSLFSVFNPDAINRASIYKGALPARFGGRLSSVLDINLREGSREKFGGKAELGLISGKIMLEGPLKKEKNDLSKTSFLISGRRTWLDLLAGPVQQLANPNGSRTNFFFYDLTAKLNHRFSQTNTLFLSFYSGRDRLRSVLNQRSFGSRERSDLEWGNLTSVLRWNKVIGLKLFSKVTAYISDYDFVVDSESRRLAGTDSLLSALRYRSKVRDYSAKWDLEYTPGKRHHLRIGLHVSRQQFDPGAVQLETGTDRQLNLDSLEKSSPVSPIYAAMYLEDEISLGEKFLINVGLRGSSFWVRNENYQFLQPRASLSFRLLEKTSIQFAYDRQAQFLHLLTNSRVGLPLDLWVSATDSVPPQSSWQVSMGVLGEWKGIQWQVEAYYKELNQVVAFEEGANFLETGPEVSTLQQNQAWESKVVEGQGNAYGLEFWIRKEQRRLTGWLSYTLAWANRQFDELNQGNEFPFIYDRRHNFSILGKYAVKPTMDLSISWFFRSGQRTTFPEGQYVGPQQLGGNFPDPVQIYGDRNAFKLPAYHRLDLTLALKKEKKAFVRTWKFGLYNAYSRLNAFSANVSTNSDPVFLRIVSLFPIIPSVSYQIEF